MFTLRPGDQAEQKKDVGLDLKGDVQVVDNVVDTQGYTSNSPGQKEQRGQRFTRVTTPVFPDLGEQLRVLVSVLVRSRL